MKSLEKRPFYPKLFRALAAGLGLASVLGIQSAKAQNAYFDVNGATTGYGTVTGGSYSWESTNWGVSGGAGTTVAWTPGTFARFYGTGNYTVTVSAVESIAGMYQNAASSTLTINATGSGGLSIVTNIQGFLINGSAENVIINAPISGPGGIENESGGGLFLYGTNTYSGGTLFGTSGGVNFNNSSSFGTGPITWGVAQQVLADPAATAPITITNSMTTRAASQLILVAPAAGPVTFSGPWTNATGLSRLTMNTAATKMTISGKIYGSAGTVLKDGPGVLVINSKDTNVSTVTVTNGTLEIATNGQLTGTIAVTNTAGVLQLDAPTNLSTAASLYLTSSLSNGAVNLNFTGSDTIFALYIDGVAQTSGTWGSAASGAQNTSALFTGTGVLNIPATPVVVQQPQSSAGFIGGSVTFSVGVSGDAPFSYQSKINGAAISGANSSSYTISPLVTNNAGSYTVVVSNTVGSATSAVATLTVLATNFYTTTIVDDGPISYWRLDEATGTNAYDAVSTNNGTYVNVTLNQPGFSLTDTDACIALPTTTNSRGYVSVANYAPFNFTSFGAPFTLEAWAYFTNFSGVQRIFSTLALSGSQGYAFGVNGNNDLRFTQGGIQDADFTLTNVLTTGVWYQLVVTCDGSDYNFFVNGVQVGSTAIVGIGTGVSVPLQFGANPPGYTTAEQVKGRLDELAIYNNNLSSDQVLAHYNARYGTLAAPVVQAPVVTPATNYASLSASFQAVAAGQALTYQWYKSPSTLISGQTGATLTLSPLQLTDAGSYYVQVSNPAGTSNSPTVALTVLPIPTNAANLNLTNGLVLHLPFDTNYADISGRGNNGTNVGVTSFVSTGVIGGSALHYFTDTNLGSFNYVTLGVVPDLQFGATTNFTVSYWIRQPAGSTFTNLPFFTDAIGSTGNGGFAFAPYAGTGGGGWMWTVGSVTSPNAATHFPDANLINDGNWHHLVHVADRSANLTTFLDGVQVDSQSIVVVGDIDTGNAATIGQDPTGAYAVTANADIDDLAVWQRTLSQLEVSGVYLAGISNGVSFAPPVSSSAPVPVALTIQQVGGQLQVSWTGTAGTLQASTNVMGIYTNVPSATSPYTVPTPQGAQMYYRLKY